VAPDTGAVTGSHNNQQPSTIRGKPRVNFSTDAVDQITDMVGQVDLVALFEVADSHRVLEIVHQRLLDAGVDLPEPLAHGSVASG
jgi:hypothetical protein